MFWKTFFGNGGKYTYNTRNSIIEENPMVSISMLKIRGIGSNPQEHGGASSSKEYSLTGTENEIDPDLVQWEDFNNKSRLEENLEKMLSCKKVILKFDVAKLDYIPGILTVPVFHCPRCFDLWKRSQEIPDKCEEAAQPTRGLPTALDEKASFILFDHSNMNYIQIRGRKKRYSIQKEVNRAEIHRRSLALAFDGENTSHKGIRQSLDPEYTPSGNDITSSQGIRKYGGLNPSEVRLLLKGSASETRLVGNKKHEGDRTRRNMKGGIPDALSSDGDYEADQRHKYDVCSRGILRTTKSGKKPRSHGKLLDSSSSSSMQRKSAKSRGKKRHKKKGDIGKGDDGSDDCSDEDDSSRTSNKHRTQRNKIIGVNDNSEVKSMEQTTQGGKKQDTRAPIYSKNDLGQLDGTQHSEAASDRSNVKPNEKNTIENTSDFNAPLTSIDETSVLTNSDIKVDAAGNKSRHNISAAAQESPAEVLARIKKRKIKPELKNPGVWKKTGIPSGNKKSLGKHIMSTSGGGGIQKLVNNLENPEATPTKSRKASIPVGGDDQYLMQGGKQPVSRRETRSESRSRVSGFFDSSETLGMTYTQSQFKYNNSNEDIDTFLNERDLNQSKHESGDFNGSNFEAGGSGSAINKQAKIRRATIKKEQRGSLNENRGKNSRSDYELPPVERLKSASNAPGSAEILALNQNSNNPNNSRPSSRLHSNCLDAKDNSFSDIQACKPPLVPLTSPNDVDTNRNTKQRMANAIDITKKQNIFKRQNMFGDMNTMKNKEDIISRASTRETLTPSPELARKISYNELMCLNMMNFTSSFTFSFYNLPEHYRKHNDGIRNKLKGKSNAGKKRNVKK